MKKFFKRLLIVLGSILGLLILVFAVFLIFSAATTLKVKDEELMEVNGNSEIVPGMDSTIKILTWNIGYGCLDEDADFYMDGGTQVNGESKEKMLANISSITGKISEINPDIFFIQEIDFNSKRSFKTNQMDLFINTFKEDEYNNSYALNFKAGFIPIPVTEPMGKVEAGISIFSKFKVNESKRIQLPIPFKWPISMLNLKRCLLVDRIKIDGSDKELVLVNLHLEAYDDGEGKAKQLAILMDLLESEYQKGNYVIAGGDFNQTFSSVDLTKYPKVSDWVCQVIEVNDYEDFTFVMDDTYPTCRLLNMPYKDADKEHHQYYMLDGFIVSNNINIKSFETINLEFKNADHNPVVMTFNFK